MYLGCVCSAPRFLTAARSSQFYTFSTKKLELSPGMGGRDDYRLRGFYLREMGGLRGLGSLGQASQQGTAGSSSLSLPAVTPGMPCDPSLCVLFLLITTVAAIENTPNLG